MTNVNSAVKHFPSAENGFADTLASTISGGATTVPLNGLAGYVDGEVVVFIVDPGDAVKEQSFTGTVDTAGVQITNVVWISGTNQTHTSGSTVVDYVDAGHISLVSKGLLVEHDQDGTHGAVTASSVTATTGTFTNLTVSGTATSEGWSPLGDVPDTITANGNRNYDIVFNGVDHTSTLSPGMKMQLTRTVAAPTKCADLEASSSQYFSKSSPAGMTFTDDFTVSAWVKLESYAAGTIISRYNGTNGWIVTINATGQPTIQGFNGGSQDYAVVYQSIPLNKWTHIAMTLDMSGAAATTYIDGVSVANAYTNGAPTALVQAGNLEIGSQNGGSTFFDGKIAQVAVFSSVLSAATIRSYMSQGLAGSESTLISAYSLDNSLLDLTANANNLTANGGAAATATDSPFANAVAAGLLEYAEVNSVSFSTNTTVNVRVPDTCQIPTSGGVSAVSYSTQSNPYGLPYFSKIIAQTFLCSNGAGNTTQSQVNGLSVTATLPANTRVKVSVHGNCLTNTAAGSQNTLKIWDGTVGSGVGIAEVNNSTSTALAFQELTANGYITTASAGSKTFNVSLAASSGTVTLNANTSGQTYFQVELV